MEQAWLGAHMYLNLCNRPFLLLLGAGDTDCAPVAEAFAGALGANRENGQYLSLPVAPDWMDSSDLFGHRRLDGSFAPGAILEFLKLAQDTPEKPFFLCLDRLILSRANYFLRELLQGVAARRAGAPYMLVNELYYGPDLFAREHYGLIGMPENLFIFATVRLRETSLPLDQRFLDQCGTLLLSREEVRQGLSGCWPAILGHSRPGTGPATEECNRLFARVNQILCKAKAYVGYEIRQEAAAYLEWNARLGLLAPETAMDLQLWQQILPRVQGSAALIGPALAELKEEFRGRYPRTWETLERMEAGCRQEGFASYWP